MLCSLEYSRLVRQASKADVGRSLQDAFQEASRQTAEVAEVLQKSVPQTLRDGQRAAEGLSARVQSETLCVAMQLWA